MRFDLTQGFPLVTTKKVHTRSVFAELLWFLRGDTNAKWLQDRGVTIRDERAGTDGALGPIYGYQWRSWPAPDGRHIDQIDLVLDQIRTNPDNRRHTSPAWNVALAPGPTPPNPDRRRHLVPASNDAPLPQLALAQCHPMFHLCVATPVAGT